MFNEYELDEWMNFIYTVHIASSTQGNTMVKRFIEMLLPPWSLLGVPSWKLPFSPSYCSLTWHHLLTLVILYRIKRVRTLMPTGVRQARGLSDRGWGLGALGSWRGHVPLAGIQFHFIKKHVRAKQIMSVGRRPLAAFSSLLYQILCLF